MTIQNQMVLQRRTNDRMKCRKGKWIRCLSISISFRLPQTTYFHITGVCKLFSCTPSRHMVFWLLKDA